jgi:dUTP pyrophosphatase
MARGKKAEEVVAPSTPPKETDGDVLRRVEEMEKALKANDLRARVEALEKRPAGGGGGGGESVGPLMVKLANADAKLPTRGSDMAAGYDMYASEDTFISVGGWKAVSTGVHMAIPTGVYGRVAPRSGLAVKNGIMVGAGVVDADYRGEVKVVLHNHGDAKFMIRKGDRIAQIVLEKHAMVSVVEKDELPASKRGDGGFGSTGR